MIDPNNSRRWAISGVAGRIRVRKESLLVLAAGLAALAIVVQAIQLFRYGMIEFKDCPLLDDWAFVDQLRAFVSDGTGVAYFFEPHNGHPSLLGRSLFYLDYLTASLDFRVLRWQSVSIVIATAALVGWQLFQDLRRTSIPNRGNWAVALILTVPACLLITSLGHWEVLTLAMAVDNCAVNLFAIAAIFLIDRWRVNGGFLAMSGAMVAALLATLCMLQGVLVWGAMILVLLIAPRRLGTLPVLAALVLAFIACSAYALHGLAPTAANVAFDPLFTVKGILILEGVPFLGAIHNQFLPSVDMWIGALTVVLSALAFGSFIAIRSPQRFIQSKYIGLMAFGTATALLITLGRHQYTVEQLAASRYATAVVSAAVGLYGLLAVSAQIGRMARNAMVGFYALTVVGLFITNRQEMRLVTARADAMTIMQDALIDGTIFGDANAVKSKFYVDEQFLPYIVTGRTFLKDRRLSLFRDRK